jgi:hypothetical protein
MTPEGARGIAEVAFYLGCLEWLAVTAERAATVVARRRRCERAHRYVRGWDHRFSAERALEVPTEREWVDVCRKPASRGWTS